MKNSQSKNGCFSSLLHRFLCSGGLPTHPSSDVDSPKPSPTRNTNTTPVGIVARLMGLDSFPNSPIMQKSRSVGSLDFLPNFQITKYHRRAVSFREVSLHDLDIPVQEKSNNLRERDTNLKKKKKKHQTVKEEEEVSSVPLKIRRKKVVVDDGFPDAKNKYKSRNYNHPLPKHDIRKKSKTFKRRETHEDYCIRVLKEVCRLTMVEIEGGVCVDTKGVNNNIQQVSYEISQQILQLLVYEIVDELCTSL